MNEIASYSLLKDYSSDTSFKISAQNYVVKREIF